MNVLVFYDTSSYFWIVLAVGRIFQLVPNERRGYKEPNGFGTLILGLSFRHFNLMRRCLQVSLALGLIDQLEARCRPGILMNPDESG